jgi:hypothetical protein
MITIRHRINCLPGWRPGQIRAARINNAQIYCETAGENTLVRSMLVADSRQNRVHLFYSSIGLCATTCVAAKRAG